MVKNGSRVEFPRQLVGPEWPLPLSTNTVSGNAASLGVQCAIVP